MFSVEFREELFDVVNYFENDFECAFEKLRFFIIFHKNELNEAEINMLIDIYKNAINNAKLKINSNTWIEKNFQHFSGNCRSNKVWYDKFTNKNFTYNELMEFIEQIKEIKDYDFLLRVPEVVLRNDIEFTKSIQVLKNAYISVLKDILNGKGR